MIKIITRTKNTHNGILCSYHLRRSAETRSRQKSPTPVLRNLTSRASSLAQTRTQYPRCTDASATVSIGRRYASSPPASSSPHPSPSSSPPPPPPPPLPSSAPPPPGPPVEGLSGGRPRPRTMPTAQGPYLRPERARGTRMPASAGNGLSERGDSSSSRKHTMLELKSGERCTSKGVRRKTERHLHKLGLGLHDMKQWETMAGEKWVEVGREWWRPFLLPGYSFIVFASGPSFSGGKKLQIFWFFVFPWLSSSSSSSSSVGGRDWRG